MEIYLSAFAGSFCDVHLEPPIGISGTNGTRLPALSSSRIAVSLSLSRTQDDREMPARTAASSKPSFSESVTRIWRISVLGFIAMTVITITVQSQALTWNVLHIAVRHHRARAAPHRGLSPSKGLLCAAITFQNLLKTHNSTIQSACAETFLECGKLALKWHFEEERTQLPFCFSPGPVSQRTASFQLNP